MHRTSSSRTLTPLRERLLLAVGLPVSLMPGCGTGSSAKPDAADPASLEPGTGTSPSTASDTGVEPVRAVDTGVASACEQGQPQRECFSRAQLEQQAGFGVGNRVDPGRIRSEAEVQALFLPDGCMPPEVVRNGCCNPATGPGQAGNEGCCYSFCSGACCGRPFYVAGRARVAEVVRRRDWLAPLRAEARGADTLDQTVRSELGARWLRDAQLEHASVAAFARFTLELLAHGAPAELVLAAQRAAMDEVEHARLCFALASRFAGCDLGPDALALGDVAPASSLRESVLLAVLEGCIGETLAAASARARLDDARCPETRRVLTRIVEDETRHAELSYRFLAWALAQPGQASLVGAIEAMLVREQQPSLAPARTQADSPSREVLRAYGWLAPGDEAALREQTFAQVIAPCIRAALSGVSTDSGVARPTQATRNATG